MTETEAEEWARRIWGAVEHDGTGSSEVHALLARVGSGAVPPQDIDRDVVADLRSEVVEAMSWAEQMGEGRVGTDWAEKLLDRYITAIVRPVPAQPLGREELLAALDSAPLRAWDTAHEMGDPGELVDHVLAHLALVRPEGVWISSEEARLLLGWYPGDRAVENPAERALAEKLEASS